METLEQPPVEDRSFDDAAPSAELEPCAWPDLSESTVGGDGRLAPVDGPTAVRIVIGRTQVARRDLPLDPRCDGPRTLLLDEAADAPVELFVQGRLIARGRLRALEGRYCVQVTETIASGGRT